MNAGVRAQNMKAWILLLLTLFFGYVTLLTFLWKRNVKSAPFSSISSMWGGNLDHLPIVEKDRIKNLYSSFPFGLGKIALIFLVVTLVLAFYTVQEFIQ